MPGWKSAFGKVLLAGVPTDNLLIVLERLPRDEIERLVNEFDAVKKQGFAFDEDVAATGSFAVASPIMDNAGVAIASIGIQAPAVHVSGKARLRLADAVRTSAGLLSVQLGYAPSSDIWDDLAAASIPEGQNEILGNDYPVSSVL